MDNGIDNLENYIKDRCNLLWIIKVRETVGAEKILLTDKISPLEINEIMRRSFFMSDQALNESLIKISNRIDEILDSISINELKEIL